MTWQLLKVFQHYNSGFGCPYVMRISISMLMSPFRTSSCTSLRLCSFETRRNCLPETIAFRRNSITCNAKGSTAEKQNCLLCHKTNILLVIGFTVSWEKKAQIPMKHNGTECLTSKIQLNLSAYIQFKYKICLNLIISLIIYPQCFKWSWEQVGLWKYTAPYLK